jgi:hypothetical protein
MIELKAQVPLTSPNEVTPGKIQKLWLDHPQIGKNRPGHE